MPVTIIPAHHPPHPRPMGPQVTSVDHLLQGSCSEFLPEQTKVVDSSFKVDKSDRYYPSPSGFFRSVIEAWGQHSHLVIRPEDVWFTILLQLNSHLHRNIDSSRDICVSRPTRFQKLLSGGSKSLLHGSVLQMADKIKPGWLVEWILPGFSTSSKNDNITALIMMMGSIEAHSQHELDTKCGMPSITLDGSKDDWQHLLNKLSRFSFFGAEPSIYAARLRPLLRRMVQTFDDPTNDETRRFWEQLVRAKRYHGPGLRRSELEYPSDIFMISGWIVGFMYWHPDGQVNARYQEHLSNANSRWDSLSLDNIIYPVMPLEEIPAGYARVMVSSTSSEWKDYWVLAGHLGKSIAQGAPQGYQSIVGPLIPEKSPPTSTTIAKVLHFLFDFARALPFSRKSTRVNKGDDPTYRSTNPRLERNNTTVQPVSGWALIASATDSPSCSQAESDGPTVEAIEYCDQHAEARREECRAINAKMAEIAAEEEHWWSTYQIPPLDYLRRQREGGMYNIHKGLSMYI